MGGGATPYNTIDLNLPSGLLWADRNIGASTPEDAGLYFQWGDTQGYTAEQVGEGEGLKPFGWGDYKFSIDGSSSNLSKYNRTDGKTVLDPEDDAAHAIMGGNWRMPTEDDFIELCMNTDIYLVPETGEEIKGNITEHGSYPIYFVWERRSSNNKGVKFYKKDDRGTYLFVPVAGIADHGSLITVGRGGYFWTSSCRNANGVHYAWAFNLGSGNGNINFSSRCNGDTARGVLAQ